MKVTAYTQDGVLNLELIGELDHHVAEQTRKELDNCISSSYEGDVVINMGHLLSFPFAIAGIVFWIWSVKRGVPAAIQRQPYRTPKKA